MILREHASKVFSKIHAHVSYPPITGHARAVVAIPKVARQLQRVFCQQPTFCKRPHI